MGVRTFWSAECLLSKNYPGRGGGVRWQKNLQIGKSLFYLLLKKILSLTKYFHHLFFTFSLAQKISISFPESPFPVGGVNNCPGNTSHFCHPSPKGPGWESFALFPVNVARSSFIFRRLLLRKQVLKYTLPAGVNNITFSTLFGGSIMETIES